MYAVHKKGKLNYMCPIYRGCGNTCRVGAPMRNSQYLWTKIF